MKSSSLLHSPVLRKCLMPLLLLLLLIISIQIPIPARNYWQFTLLTTLAALAEIGVLLLLTHNAREKIPWNFPGTVRRYFNLILAGILISISYLVFTEILYPEVIYPYLVLSLLPKWIVEALKPVNNIAVMIPPIDFIHRLLGTFYDIVASIKEEILYRWYLMNRIYTLTRNRWFALLFQAFIFSLGHSYYGPIGMFFIFLDGILFGAVYMFFRNIIPSSILHILINLWIDAGIDYDKLVDRWG